MYLPAGHLGYREELFLGAALLEARAQWEKSADTRRRPDVGTLSHLFSLLLRFCNHPEVGPALWHGFCSHFFLSLPPLLCIPSSTNPANSLSHMSLPLGGFPDHPRMGSLTSCTPLLLCLNTSKSLLSICLCQVCPGDTARNRADKLCLHGVYILMGRRVILNIWLNQTLTSTIRK